MSESGDANKEDETEVIMDRSCDGNNEDQQRDAADDRQNTVLKAIIINVIFSPIFPTLI